MVQSRKILNFIRDYQILNAVVCRASKEIAKTPSPLPTRRSTRQTPKVKTYVEEDSDEAEDDQVEEEIDEQEDEEEAEVVDALVADVSLPPVSDGDDEVAESLSGSDD